MYRNFSKFEEKVIYHFIISFPPERNVLYQEEEEGEQTGPLV